MAAKETSLILKHAIIGPANAPTKVVAGIKADDLKARTYLVRRGDNLTKIADVFQITVGEIVKSNKGIRNPDKIPAGYRIIIPDRPEETAVVKRMRTAENTAARLNGELSAVKKSLSRVNAHRNVLAIFGATVFVLALLLSYLLIRGDGKQEHTENNWRKWRAEMDEENLRLKTLNASQSVRLQTFAETIADLKTELLEKRLGYDRLKKIIQDLDAKFNSSVVIDKSVCFVGNDNRTFSFPVAMIIMDGEGRASIKYVRCPADGCLVDTLLPIRKNCLNHFYTYHGEKTVPVAEANRFSQDNWNFE
ncbi:LysM peptidoglycan-binding domain-containing protein [Candidatus Giovannonibacteria bacterium]|nr:LysM peptidoglycan-binding domain-containing protein [Candidatus Giovannonibacteria bacterium]